MSFSDEDASAWNVFAAEEHLGGRSSSLGRRGCEGTWRMLPHLANIPPCPLSQTVGVNAISSRRRTAPM